MAKTSKQKWWSQELYRLLMESGVEVVLRFLVEYLQNQNQRRQGFEGPGLYDDSDCLHYARQIMEQIALDQGISTALFDSLVADSGCFEVDDFGQLRFSGFLVQCDGQLAIKTTPADVVKYIQEQDPSNAMVWHLLEPLEDTYITEWRHHYGVKNRNKDDWEVLWQKAGPSERSILFQELLEEKFGGESQES